MKMRAEQGVAGYAPQVARPQNADVQLCYLMKDDSESFDRRLAIQCIASHKHDMSFRLSASTPSATINELTRLGCAVSYNQELQGYIVTSSTPFETIVNRCHRKEDLKAIALSLVLRILYYFGCPAFFLIAHYFDMGYATAGLWFIGWPFILHGTFPDSDRVNRKIYLIIGLTLFILGFVAYGFGLGMDQ